MSLVALDGQPLVKLGCLLNPSIAAAWQVTNTTQDAAKEASIYYGNVMTDDGASHTIDTTGSSSLQWRSGSVTFANAGTTFAVGLATMDAATGPVGRATNVADVITMSVSKTHTGGGGGVTANAWQTNVPDSGTMTVANGDVVAFCTQMTALGGVDTINTSAFTTGTTQNRPSTSNFTGGAYATIAALPNCIISFSDGHLGWFAGGSIVSSVTAQTWNSGSATKEYGNYLQFPFPVKIYGIYGIIAVGGDLDLVLYSDPLGTPVAEKTVAVDSNVVAASSVREINVLFPAPYTAYANQPLAVIMKPGGTNITSTYKSLNAAAHQVTDHCGTNGYAVNRASGAFATQNSNKDRFPIGLLVGVFSDGGFPASRVSLGM